MLPSLYIITNARQARQATGSLEATVGRALSAGARLVQLRDKDLDKDRFRELAERLVPLAHRHGAQIVINTRVAVARRTGADGVHQPSDGQKVGAIRRRIGRKCLVGASAHSLGEVRRAARQGADFATLSPIFKSPSKPDYGPALKLDTLQHVCRQVDLPVFALAGVSPARVQPCLDAGAHGVAVMGGVMASTRPSWAVRQYLDHQGLFDNS